MCEQRVGVAHFEQRHTIWPRKRNAGAELLSTPSSDCLPVAVAASVALNIALLRQF